MHGAQNSTELTGFDHKGCRLVHGQHIFHFRQCSALRGSTCAGSCGVHTSSLWRQLSAVHGSQIPMGGYFTLTTLLK